METCNQCHVLYGVSHKPPSQNQFSELLISLATLHLMSRHTVTMQDSSWFKELPHGAVRLEGTL